MDAVFFGGTAPGIEWDWLVPPAGEKQRHGVVRGVAGDSLARALKVCSGMVLISAQELPGGDVRTHEHAAALCQSERGADAASPPPLRCRFRLLPTSTNARVQFALAALEESRGRDHVAPFAQAHPFGRPFGGGA